VSVSALYRRIVKLGNSYYVSLPKDWLKAHGLDKGGTVAMQLTEEGFLQVRPAATPARRRPQALRITAIGDWPREVIRAYLLGYEVLEIEGLEDSDRPRLDPLLRLLVGLEVVGEEKGRITLQCFIREDYDVIQVLSRMDVLTRSMYLDAARGVEEGDESLLRAVRRRDDKVDRLYFLAVRLLRGSTQALAGEHPRAFLVDARLVAKLLEEIGDEAERLTYVNPGARGLLEAARRIARCQQAVIRRFVGERRHGVACPSLSDEIGEAGDAAWLGLRRIASLVMDLAEVVY